MFFTVYVLGTCSFRLCKHKTESKDQQYVYSVPVSFYFKNTLRATASKYGESHDSSENSDFLSYFL